MERTNETERILKLQEQIIDLLQQQALDLQRQLSEAQRDTVPVYVQPPVVPTFPITPIAPFVPTHWPYHNPAEPTIICQTVPCNGDYACFNS